MKKFEYKAVTVPMSIPVTTKQYEKIAQELEAQLNNLGADGWELIQHKGRCFLFKREIE